MYSTFKMIYDGLDALAFQLEKIGIKVEKIEPEQSAAFILDAEKNVLLLSDFLSESKEIR